MKHFILNQLLLIFKAILFIVLLVFSNRIAYAQSLCPMIEDESHAPEPYEGLELTDPKCMKIKFHYFNNTHNPINVPADELIRNLLGDLKKYYLPGNIQFHLVDECVNVQDHDSIKVITAVNNVDSAIIDQNGKGKTWPPFNYVENAINVFIFQQSFNNSDGFGYGQQDTINKYVYSILDAKVLAHEIGHVLSLWHTSAFNILLDSTTWECKGGSAIKGDRISDTDADPIRMDADRDGTVDGTKWVNNCTQLGTLTPSIRDGCGNGTLPWKIPFKNLMADGYSRSCWNSFTQGQFSAMHREIDENLEAYITNCEYDTSFCTGNILISSATTWTNVVKKMCPGSKITITPFGSLTLVNSTITKGLIDTACTDLIGNWDGIYILGGNAKSIPPPLGGGPSINPRGFLHVRSGSKIEFSNNGIQAPNGSGGILIDSSNMQNNFKMINVKDKGQKNFSSFDEVGGIVIRNGSTLVVPEDCFNTQIQIEGASITLDKSTLTKSTRNNLITGIKSMAGSVLIKNGSIIENMGRGINKETDGTYKQGLNGLRIQDSRFINCDIAIRNRCMYASVKHNWIDGEVDQEMESYGLWHSNNFRKQLIIKAPTTTQQFEENYFYQSTLKIPGDQSLTNAICNTWKNTDECVYDNNTSGSNIPIKPSWGNPSTASGNKRADTISNYRFVSIRTSEITNYRFTLDPKTHITCEYQFKSGNAAANRAGCKDTLSPTTVTSGNPAEEETYDDDENHATWTTFDSMRQLLTTAMQYASDSMRKIMQEQIADYKVGMELCVLSAMQHSDSLEMNEESFETWLSRTNPKAEELTIIQNYWHKLYLDTLLTYLGGLSIADSAELVDKGILELATEYLDSLQSVDYDLYNLPDSLIEYLEELASTSFEDYTGILRAFLNMYYNRYIDNDQMAEYSNKISGSIITNNQKTNFFVSPNPTNGFFRLYSLDGRKYTLNLEFYSLDGKKLKSMKNCTGESIYLTGFKGNECIILRLEDQKSGHKESMKLILNKD
ncbi:MAG: hypothetical protein V9E90_16400 [Saprospiraceae bacterium]